MTKLAGDHIQVLVDGYELTGDLNRVAIDDQRNAYDVTAFGDALHNVVLGSRAVAFNHAGYLNADSARSHPVLKDLTIDGVISVILGQNTDPDEGDPMYSLLALQGRYGAVPQVGTYVPFAAAFANRGSLGGWGVALAVPSTFSTATSTTGPTVDNGAETTGGGAAYLHVLGASVGDTYDIEVQMDTTSGFSSPTQAALFTLDGSALGSERIAIDVSIEQYTRWQVTRTSGSTNDDVKMAISLVRF